MACEGICSLLRKGWNARRSKSETAIIPQKACRVCLCPILCFVCELYVVYTRTHAHTHNRVRAHFVRNAPTYTDAHAQPFCACCCASLPLPPSPHCTLAPSGCSSPHQGTLRLSSRSSAYPSCPFGSRAWDQPPVFVFWLVLMVFGTPFLAGQKYTLFCSNWRACTARSPCRCAWKTVAQAGETPLPFSHRSVAE
jgi:hypothetical protein